MTAAEIFNSVTNGGGDDFAEVVKVLDAEAHSWA
jgi:hypothetical protein